MTFRFFFLFFSQEKNN